MTHALGDFVSEDQVINHLGISRATVRRQIVANDFAPRYRLSPHRIVFKWSEVLDWVKSKKVA
jgi:predicted DNA-binding transcriptional regulator AlpA